MSNNSHSDVQLQTLPHGQGLPLPSYESDQAAGIDIPAAVPAGQAVTIAPGERVLIPSGFAIALPTGYEGQIRPRSGLALRHGITVLNTPGTIDADYRGEVKILLINHGAEPFVVERGQRIAQLVIAPVSRPRLVTVQALDRTVRGSGGFGSTGIDEQT